MADDDVQVPERATDCGDTRISILVVTYNSAEHLRSCLAFTHDVPEPVEVLIWDNHSSDGSVAAASAAASSAVVVASDENVGFARAVNALVRRATGTHLLLLNPDCVIGHQDVKDLLAVLLGDPSLAAVGPVVASEAGSRHVGGGWQPSIPRMVSELCGLPNLIGTSGIWARSRPVTRQAKPLYPVDWVSGTCLLARMEAVRRVGGLSEEWFMYCEDMDLGARLAAAGYTAALVPGVSVQHVGGASHGGEASPTRSMQVTSLLSYHRGRLHRLRRLRSESFRLLLFLYLGQRWVLLPRQRTQYAALMSALKP